MSAPRPILLLLATLVLGHGPAAQRPRPGDTPPPLAAAWHAFQDRHGDGWQRHVHPATGTPRAIFGPGLPIPDWRENSLEAARVHADRVLREHADLLGLGTSTFRESLGARIGRQWSFVYEQYFRGLPVLGGRADVRVSMAGRIAMLGSTAWPIPADFDPAPRIGPEVATAAAWLALGQAPTGAPQPAAPVPPRLVIWGDADAPQLAPFHLAWEVAIQNLDHDGNGPVGRYYVDAHGGAILHYTNDLHQCGLAGCTLGHPAEAGGDAAAGALAEASANAPATAPVPVNTLVRVRTWARTGLDANAPLSLVALAGVEVTVGTSGTAVTNANGEITINISSPRTVSVGRIDGLRHAEILGTDQPNASILVSPGVPTTLLVLPASATDTQVAHSTAHWWLTRANEHHRTILGNSPQLALLDGIVPTVNAGGSCNAFYTNNTVRFLTAGDGCTNTATATIIAHEWGHGLDDRYGGISQTEGLSEGWADIVAMYLVDDPRIGIGMITPNVGIRTGNNDRQYPTGSSVHQRGESWMGFAWKLRERLTQTLGSRAAAIARSNEIVIGTIAANAANQQAAVLEVFLADDDDGNLANGTPNFASLVWACNQHSLPHPGPQIPANDECLDAIPVANGMNGPFSSASALASAPAWPCATAGADVWFRYLVGAPGTLTVSTCGEAAFNTALQAFHGTCGALTSLGCNDNACGLQSSLTVPVTPGVCYIRVGGVNSATGSFRLHVDGPAGVEAATTAYGGGCYEMSRAFYELFPATGFDLGGSFVLPMQLELRNGRYVARHGGIYMVPPASATELALADDASVTVNLASALPYPGGTTSSMVVCSNGFVSVASGNGNSALPSVSSWLGSAQARWGTWHDFNPAATGSGKVKFHENGSRSFVTWHGVYSYGTTDANTWQLQFDRANGTVTFCWPTIVSSGNAWLVGFAAQGPNRDLGSRDLSATLPGGFQTHTENAPPMALSSTLPRLGSSVLLTTTQVPAAAPLGVQIVGFTGFDPGVDLAAIGMPDCRLFTGLDLVDPVLPVGGQSVHGLWLPNDLSLQGLVLHAQTAAFLDGINPAGLVASNGVRMVVGQ
ncbi:MAG: hypothetical protein KF830_17080 [Planctomycetes bacterium]|nr:hypothetical protein [Planctomycetota bacterium]